MVMRETYTPFIGTYREVLLVRADADRAVELPQHTGDQNTQHQLMILSRRIWEKIVMKYH